MNYSCYKDYEFLEFITMILQCSFIAFQDFPMLFIHIVKLIVESEVKRLLESLIVRILFVRILFVRIFSTIFHK